MSIKSIKIKNLLSFDHLIINDFKDINCIVGVNNVGKSNLLKLVSYFYNKLENQKLLPPDLNHKYSSFGLISITYNLSSRLRKRLKENGNKDFLKKVLHLNDLEIHESEGDYLFTLTLTINSDDSTSWSIKDIQVLRVINYYYPFFDIESRHLNLHNWDKLWDLIISLKSFNLNKLEKIIFNNKELMKNDSYREYKAYVNEINSSIETSKYSYKDKLLTYLKIQLKGDIFLNNNNNLEMQSDGTNAYKYIDTFLQLLIVLTRRDYITPIIYIDEPEVGLHPKKNENLIDNLYKTYSKYNSNVPYPTIIFATHSPNILKQVVKLFDNQQVLHFTKTQDKHEYTRVNKLNSKFEEKFLNIFSDNEARLFFSKFILFVEGETELEIFLNKNLQSKFRKLKYIDIYKSSSNVIGKNVNPSHLNAAIPYLFLFDADKIYQVTKKEKYCELQLKNSNAQLYILPTGKKSKDISFERIVKKYKKGFNNKHIDFYYKLLDIQSYNKMKLKYSVFLNNLESEKLNIIYNTLNSYLNIHNVKFVKTTIEEVLINQDSKEIFFKWLSSEYNCNFSDFLLKRVKSTSKVFIYKRRQSNLKVEYLTPRSNLKKHIFFTFRKRNQIDKLLVDYIRVKCFNGKFENLRDSIISKDNTMLEKEKVYRTLKKELKSSKTEITSKQEMSILKKLGIINNNNIEILVQTINKNIDKLNIPRNAKTGGWATKFINYAITEIIQESKSDDDFNNKFKIIFRELYAIILRIEEQLPSDR